MNDDHDGDDHDGDGDGDDEHDHDDDDDRDASASVSASALTVLCTAQVTWSLPNIHQDHRGLTGRADREAARRERRRAASASPARSRRYGLPALAATGAPPAYTPPRSPRLHTACNSPAYTPNVPPAHVPAHTRGAQRLAQRGIVTTPLDGRVRQYQLYEIL